MSTTGTNYSHQMWVSHGFSPFLTNDVPWRCRFHLPLLGFHHGSISMDPRCICHFDLLQSMVQGEVAVMRMEQRNDQGQNASEKFLEVSTAAENTWNISASTCNPETQVQHHSTPQVKQDTESLSHWEISSRHWVWKSRHASKRAASDNFFEAEVCQPFHWLKTQSHKADRLTGWQADRLTGLGRPWQALALVSSQGQGVASKASRPRLHAGHWVTPLKTGTKIIPQRPPQKTKDCPTGAFCSPPSACGWERHGPFFGRIENPLKLNVILSLSSNLRI